MNPKLKPSEIVVLVSGIAGFLLTLPFAPWFSFPSGYGDGGFSAWSTDGNLFPLATYIPLICLLMALHVGLTKFANVQMPPQVLGYSWTQIHLVLAFFTVLIALGFLLSGAPDPLGLGLGFWMGTLASIGLLVGAIMEYIDDQKPAMGGYPGQQYPGQQPYPGQPGQPPYPGQPGQPPYPGQQGPPPDQPPQQF